MQIEGPDWFAPINLARVGDDGLPMFGRIATPHFDGVTWELEYACGQDALDSQFQPLAGGSGDVNGQIARLSRGLLAQLADTCDGSVYDDAGLAGRHPLRGVARRIPTRAPIRSATPSRSG